MQQVIRNVAAMARHSIRLSALRTFVLGEAFATMTQPDFKKASMAAATLLKKYRFKEPPVDPEWISEREGLTVIYADFEAPDDEKVSGFFDLNQKTIYVNKQIHENRITFTIAHELAHFILHREYIESQEYIPMPRNNEYDGPKPKEEVEADTFAANLLVPLSSLKEYKYVSTIDQLATLYFVSEEVIRNRLDLLRRFPNLAR